MLKSRQKVEQYRFSCLKLTQYQLINLEISTLAPLITSVWSDEAVTAENFVIEPLIEIASLTYIEQLSVRDEDVDTRNVISINREGAERTESEPVQLSVSFI